MTMTPVKKNQAVEDKVIAAAMAMPDMVTVKITLCQPGQVVILAMPRNEWLKLVSDFVRMQADERQRMSVSIRDAVAESPFPEEGDTLTPAQEHVCDVFANDCVLLAALAEATGSERLLLDTAVESFKVTQGLPDIAQMRGAFH